MNDTIQQYIIDAKAKGQDDISIKQNLLNKGWTPEEVDIAFVATGLSTEAPSAGIAREKAGRQAKWSLILAVSSVVLFYIWLPLSVLAALSGLVFSILGIKSNHKVMAIIALVIIILYAIFTAFLIYVFAHITETHSWPFSNEPLTEAELIEFGIQ